MDEIPGLIGCDYCGAYVRPQEGERAGSHCDNYATHVENGARFSARQLRRIRFIP
jgi:hypothetical protein